MLLRIYVLTAFVGALLIGCVQLAMAQPQPQPVAAAAAPAADPGAAVEADPIGTGQQLYAAVKSGQYWYAFGLILAVLVAVFRIVMQWWEKEWWQSDRGGVAAVGIISLLSLAAVAIMAGEAPSWGLLAGVLQGALLAMGGYAGLKKLLYPKG